MTPLAMGSTRETLDPGERATLDSSGDGVLPESVWAFQAEAPRRLSALTLAIADGAANAVVRHARRLKNNALNVGALRLAEVCEVIEQKDQVGHLPLTPQLTALLEGEFEAAGDALADLGD